MPVVGNFFLIQDRAARATFDRPVSIIRHSNARSVEPPFTGAAPWREASCSQISALDHLLSKKPSQPSQPLPGHRRDLLPQVVARGTLPAQNAMQASRSSGRDIGV